MSLGEPDNLLCCWTLPEGIGRKIIGLDAQNDKKTDESDTFSPFVQNKVSFSIRLGRSASQLNFSEPGILFAIGKSSFDVLGVLEQQFKQISSLNLKRLTAELNVARIVPHSRRYSLILSEQTQEILVLRGEMAVGFLPSELLSGKLQATPGADGE